MPQQTQSIYAEIHIGDNYLKMSPQDADDFELIRLWLAKAEKTIVAEANLDVARVKHPN